MPYVERTDNIKQLLVKTLFHDYFLIKYSISWESIFLYSSMQIATQFKYTVTVSYLHPNLIL